MQPNQSQLTPDQPQQVDAALVQPVEDVTPEVVVPKIEVSKPKGPSFFGYKPPKWAHDFDYVRLNKGKGKPGEARTWLLYAVDRLLKMHSI